MICNSEDIEITYRNSCNSSMCFKSGEKCRFYNYCNSSNKSTNMCKCETSKEEYENTKKLNIISSNIIDIKLVSNIECCCDIKPDTNKNEEVKILLLGISATQLRFIIINMKFIDDQMDDAFKEINFKTGNRYKVVYNEKESSTDKCNCGNIYELTGTLTSIQPITDCACRNPDTSNSIVRAVTCNHPEEIVGLYNSIYPATDCSTDKDKFLSGEPIKEDYYLTFDTTSMPMNSTSTTIKLSQIRDVDLLCENTCNNDTTSSECICTQDALIFTTNDHKYYITPKGEVIFEKNKDGCICTSEIYKLEDILNYYFSN